MMRLGLTVVLSTSLSFGAFAAEDAESARAKWGAKLAQTLETEDSADVLVYFATTLSKPKVSGSKAEKTLAMTRFLRQAARASQAEVASFAKERGLRHEAFFITNAIAIYDVSLKDLEKISKIPNVLKVRSNGLMSQPLVRGSRGEITGRGIEASLAAINAPNVWDMYNARGEGIVVAGQDTGIDWDHPGLRASYRGTNEDGGVSHDYHWYDGVREPVGKVKGTNSCGYALSEPCDDHGHGTHTLGTMVGDDGQGNQVGVAPGARWIGCRNMDEGTGRPSMYLTCFQFFLAPFPLAGDPFEDGDPSQAADVVNNSWGCPASELCEGDEFLQVLLNLEDAGIAIVSAAGNAGSRCATISDAPAHHSDANFAVGALDHRSGRIASFSSRGPSTFDNGIGPDVTAPGVTIRSTVPGGRYGSFGWSGTSMAAPHVAGVVALLWSAVPELKGDVATTWSILQATATAKTSTETCGGTAGTAIPNNTYGYGMVNAQAAVEAARALR